MALNYLKKNVEIIINSYRHNTYLLLKEKMKS